MLKGSKAEKNKALRRPIRHIKSKAIYKIPNKLKKINKMKTNKYIGYYFESSTRKTPEFNNFARAFRTDIKEQTKNDFILEEFNTGHFYCSGFLKSIANGKYVYFSIPDVRYFLNEWRDNILIRTAEHLKDYTGGANNKTTLEEFNNNILKLI